jgi:hypothetical protein
MICTKGPGQDKAGLYACFSAAGRKLGTHAAEGRARILVVALEGATPPDQVEIVEELFRTGDLDERWAVVRTLCRLEAPERFAAVAIEAVRSNAVSMLEAVACDTPYPARHFSAAAFNQMVVKCLFVGLPLGRVVGLVDRVTPALEAMVAGYARELTHAGRALPDDVALILKEKPHETV